MKKMLLIGMAAILLAGIMVASRDLLAMGSKHDEGGMTAKEKHEMMEKCHHEGCCMMSPKGHMMMACHMHGMMMENMMMPKMVATSDGGVAVMAYGKVTKYDKDMNAVKEVELKPDVEAMKKMMTEMMEGCPMCKHMMEKGEYHEKAMMHEKAEK